MKDCCGSSADKSQNDVREIVREGYAKVAQTGSLTVLVNPKDGGCCGTVGCGSALSAEELAQKIGYSADEIKALPDGANMGLSCGNPTAIANLKVGQVVLDLGSGGGFDVFLAGPKVGATGRVIGVDMTPEMISKARRSLAIYRKNSGFDNAEFRLGEIENLPVADNSVDVVISNCVINLSPDKPRVWQEIARVLKPGGKVVASDIALLRPLPDEVKQMIEALVGCVAGAIMLDEYKLMVNVAGLVEVSVKSKPEYIAALSSFNDPLYQKIVEELPPGTSAADFLASVDVTASKAASL